MSDWKEQKLGDCYFLASHNTMCGSNQLFTRKSGETFYTKVLEHGCRAIEIDISSFDTEKIDFNVSHGFFGSGCSLVSILDLINPHVTPESLPLFIFMDLRTTDEPELLCDILEEKLGRKIYTEKVNRETKMNIIMGKIIIFVSSDGEPIFNDLRDTDIILNLGFGFWNNRQSLPEEQDEQEHETKLTRYFTRNIVFPRNHNWKDYREKCNFLAINLCAMSYFSPNLIECEWFSYTKKHWNCL